MPDVNSMMMMMDEEVSHRENLSDDIHSPVIHTARPVQYIIGAGSNTALETNHAKIMATTSTGTSSTKTGHHAEGNTYEYLSNRDQFELQTNSSINQQCYASASKRYGELPAAITLWSDNYSERDSTETLIWTAPQCLIDDVGSRSSTPSTLDFESNTQPPTREQDLKKQKTPVFWPLPTVTYRVGVVTLIVSLLAALDILPAHCTAPSHVLYQLDISRLLISPFYVPMTFPAVILGAGNLLLLGLFENSLKSVLGGGTRRFTIYLIFIFAAVLSLRQALGYLFSRCTGWAIPMLFFNDTMHECSDGLAPFLFSLLILQTHRIYDMYVIRYGRQANVSIPKVLLQLTLLLANCLHRNILWWSMTGMIVGLIAAIPGYVQRIQISKLDMLNQPSIKKESQTHMKTFSRTNRRAFLLNALSSLRVVTLASFFLLIANAIYSHTNYISPDTLNELSDDPYLITFLILTAPRPTNPKFLITTINSYLDHFPENPEPTSVYTRMQIVVYTHFTQHEIYDLAHELISNTVKGQKYVTWIREEGSTRDQPLHMSKALNLMMQKYQSTYIALMEDDFPLCEGVWPDILQVIWEANQRSPDHCGIFIGSGGSGLFLRPNILPQMTDLLVSNQDMPPDILMHKCLLGEIPVCSKCANTFVISRTMLMRHLGFNTSTSDTRRHRPDEYQCGWRHPFNGDPNIVTI
jgi:hypothetical protein